MRPKKLILVLDPDPTSLGITMFSLSVNGYRTVGAHTVAQARSIIAENPVDAILWTQCNDYQSLPQEFTIPSVMKSMEPKLGDMDRILEELRWACMKKRGPKPGTRHPQK